MLNVNLEKTLILREDTFPFKTNVLMGKKQELVRVFTRTMHSARNKVAPEVMQSVHNNKPIILPKVTTALPHNTNIASQNTDKIIKEASEISKIRQSADLAAKKSLFIEQLKFKGSMVQTVVDCLKNGMPLEEIAIQVNLHEVSNGDGIRFMEYLANMTEVFPRGSIMNAQRIIKKEEWDMLPVPFQNLLSRLSLKKQGMLLFEILAPLKVNRDFIHNRLGFAFHVEITHDGVNGTYRYEADFSDKLNYHNQTPNKHPDNVLVLNEPVIVEDQAKNLIAYDVKFGELQPSRNIIKSCTTDAQFIEKLELAHDCLIGYLKRQKATLSSSDREIAEFLTKDLEQNLSKFTETKDSAQFRATYHGFHEKYASFLIRNSVGFNLLARFTLEDFVIEEASKSEFSATFQTYFNDQKGLARAFAQKVANENGVSQDPSKFIREFTKEILNKK